MPSPSENQYTSSFDPNICRQILPQAVMLESVEIGNYCGDLYQQEYLSVASAVAKRKNEFSSGRLCARRALSQLNLARCPLPVGPDRQPMWPEKITGSISHDGNYAVAVAVSSVRIPLIGIDLVLNDTLDSSTIEMVCTQKEISDVTGLIALGEVCDPFKLVFSLKEALFKCLFPVVCRIFDFKEASITLLPALGTAEVFLEKSVLPAQSNFPLQARYCFSGSYIFSTVWMGNPS